jgi:O-antigen/teichoic acid export membrane protein
MSYKAILANSFFYNGLNTIQAILFGLLNSLLFTRILGLEIFGEFSLVASYISIFFSVITSGILTGFKREAVRFSTNNENVGNFLFSIFLFTVIAVVLFSLIIFIFENSFFNLFNIQKEYRNILIFYLVSHVLFFFPGQLLIFTFESFQDIKPLFKINLLSNFIKAFGIILLIFFIVNVNNAIIVYFLVPNFTILFFSYRYIRNNYNFKINLKELRHSLKSFKNAFTYSLKLYPLMLAELVIGNIAIVLLGKYHSTESVGVFKILFNYYLVIKFIPQFFGKVITPTLTNLFFENKKNKIITYYNFTFKLSILLCSLITIFFLGFVEELLGIYGINGSEYVIGMTILLASNIVLTGHMIGGVFQAYNNPQFISLFVGIGSLSNYFLAVYLIPDYGITGACISIFISNLISQVGLHYYAVKKLKFKIDIKKFIISILIVFFLGIIVTSSHIYNDSIVLKSFIILILIISYLTIMKFYGFFNSNELNQLVLFSDKFDNKYLKSIIRFIKI